MSRVFDIVVFPLIMGVFFYLFASFCAWDLNPHSWSGLGRGVALIVWVVLCISWWIYED